MTRRHFIASISGAVVASAVLPAQVGRSSDLVLVPRQRGGFEDGDILHAVPALTIDDSHCWWICRRKWYNFNLDGLRPAGSLAEVYDKHTSVYLFRRVGRAAIEKVEISTGNVVDQFDANPATSNSGEEYIHVEEFIRRNQTKIYGTAGAEYWYEDPTTLSPQRISNIWDEIEAQTAGNSQLRLMIRTHPKMGYSDAAQFGTAALTTNARDVIVRTRLPFRHSANWRVPHRRRNLVIRCADLSPARAAFLEQPVLNEREEVVKDRKHHVAWRLLTGMDPPRRLAVDSETPLDHANELERFIDTVIVDAK